MEIRLKIFINRISLSSNTKEITEYPDEPFSTDRLLVGNFDSAFECVEKAGKKLSITGLFKPKPHVIVEPKELIEGGISQIEERVFRELTLSLRPKRVEILG